MSTQQDFDRLLKERLSNMGTAPTEDKWAILEQKLNAIVTPAATENSPTVSEKPAALAWYRKPFIRGIAAALILLMGVATTFLLSKNKTTNDVVAKKEATTNDNNKTTVDSKNNAVAQHNATNNTSTPINNEVVPNNNSNNIASNNVVSNQTTPQYTNTTSTQNNNATTAAHHINNKNAPIAQNNNTTAAVQNNDVIINNVINKNIQEVATTTVVATTQQNYPTTNSNAPVEPHKPTTNKTNQPLPFQLQEKPRYATVWPKSSINIIATSALGSLGVKTSAYNLGVNTERKISNRLFVDATIAYAANNPTSIQNALYANANEDVALAKNISTNSSLPTNIELDVYGVNNSDNSFRAGGNNIPIEELSSNAGIAEAAAYRLSNAQIEAAPMIGYRITPRIAIMAGGDASRILKTSKYNDALDHLNLINRTPIQTNNWDAGLAGKVECKITKRIMLGVRYRAGITNIVNNGTINTRRNYTGIVLKTRLR